MLSSQPTGSEDRLLADLTAPQREAVTHVDGPLLVLAGAGSGKTRVITRRAAYLISQAGAAYHVLAVTFTNKAANEMRERLIALGVGDRLMACTFHSFCARLLRIHHDRAGVDPNFTIYDEVDRKKVVEEALDRCDLRTEQFRPRFVTARISRAKNAMATVEAFKESATDWTDRSVARIYEAYEAILGDNRALDFDDLLMRVARLLHTDEELRAELEDRYRYLLVDEYQDTNVAQYEVARSLAREHKNICVTGDPDQSIYRWRGADITNILRFEEEYPDARVVRLEQNYRSTKRILSAADALINNNVDRKSKGLWTENDEGAAVRVVECEDEAAEGSWIAAQIQGQLSEGRRPSDMAVFYRNNALSRSVEEAFITARIPYQVARGVAFYQRKEIKDLLAYLRVLINPADEIALLRIINTPTRGIGMVTVERLMAWADSRRGTLMDAVANAKRAPKLGAAAATRVVAFAELLVGMKPLVDRPPADALKLAFSRSGLCASLTGEEKPDSSAAENIEELVSAAAHYQELEPEATLRDWLSHTSLLGDVDSVDESAGAVTLMTLHAAKGLEFPSVFIIGLEDGLLPAQRPSDHDQDIEEERRLCFVGITRARQELVLTRARWRMRYGQTLRTVASPFLSELPSEEIEFIALPSTGRRRRGSIRQGDDLPDDIEHWEVGTLVRDPIRGLGRLIDLHEGGGSIWAKVEFQTGDRQTFNLGFAKLERVDYHEVD